MDVHRKLHGFAVQKVLVVLDQAGQQAVQLTGSSGAEDMGSRDKYSSATMISVRLSTVARMR
ncbi:hypothetical protein PSYAE_13692 [Pseudomonas amygdali pv. aesculi str. 0893_23]|nr:hypothetical protein PSYAE_13692 [Pseudomonas amygdali pv. aesculi str. 0893_23]